MSLQQLAQHMQSHGRGEDKMLVHMTPGEVGGLQSLAMAHGGSLTINPQTGLPEAGFLSKILPTIIGAGVGIATMNPMLGAAAGGAAGMAMNGGSLQAGLMAGIGSYGLGGLGAGLAGAGAGTVGSYAGALGVPGAATGAGSQAAMLASQTAGFGAEGLGSVASAAGSAAGAAPVLPSTFDNIRAGIGAVGEQPGGWGQFMKSNMLPIASAAAPLLMGGLGGDNKNAAPDSEGYIRPYDMQTQVNGPSYTPGRPYMTRTFTPQEPVKSGDWGSRSFDNGGIVALANGGSSNAANRYGITGNTPLLAGAEQANQGIVGQTPDYLRPENNPSNIFGTAFNPYTPMGFQAYGQNRYGPPTAQTNMPLVDQYNKSLAEQANLEYMGQPTLAAFMSQQRKELERAYKEKLDRAPDAASQKDYLEQMDQGATLDDIKTQMEVNPPTAEMVNASINSTIDTTPSQTSVPSNLGVVETPYGTPGAVEQSASVNRQAVDDLARVEADRVAADLAEPIEQPLPNIPGTPPPPPPPPPPPVRDDPIPVRDDTPTGPTAEEIWQEQQRILEQQQADERKRLADEAEAKRIADEAAAKAAEEAAVVPERQFITTNYDSGAGYYTDGAMSAEDAAAQQFYQDNAWVSGDGGANGGMPGVDFARYAGGGGISSLGSYSDGGQLLKGPGDGVSDSIPARIGAKQPARLADGEFVIPARIVSEIGNGSTDAGAKQLYAMMERIQKNRKKTVGKGKVAVDAKSRKMLPA
jgi:hypothetical protein